MKNKCPDDEKIERTKELNEKFSIKDGEEITEIFFKSDVLLLACVFEKFLKVSVCVKRYQYEFGINPLYCVSLAGYTWDRGVK